ncbi:unnamed protein product [Ceutorhynchus assimilis]|uniref:Deoxyuridine 5'-triphosphate nucleotidohydrolase n=1 Tax=Ceutorhynchus assimilis TaxID=467358 RepID=A0A9N9QSA4_9CUCU|nr:unnamed protein product [Ceutorhynchus assimilis]
MQALMHMMNSGKSCSVLKFTRSSRDAYVPTKGSDQAAGFDLKSIEEVLVPARSKALINTGIKIELPFGCYGRIAARSGLALHHSIDIGAGVIDPDYRGIVQVLLFNHSDKVFRVRKGDRIAQLICEKIYLPELEEVSELQYSQRGENGFGSTGTN